MEGWTNDGAQNFILKVAAEHLADFNSPAEQKNEQTKKQLDFLST